MQPSIIQNQIVMWAVVAVYMVIITLAGGYYSKYMRTADAYFKGNNLIPWWAAGISTYIAHFTAYTFVAIASLVYIDGLSGLLLETGPALVYMTVAVVFARRWHRLNLTARPDRIGGDPAGPAAALWDGNQARRALGRDRWPGRRRCVRKPE
jgi:Na+(H+)/acetate symporter ActP